VIDLYAAPTSNGLRAKIMLDECGLPYTLHKIDLAEKVKVDVPINLVGTAFGVKEGGLLDFAMHAVAVECLPNQIPAHLDVDVADLAIGGLETRR